MLARLLGGTMFLVSMQGTVRMVAAGRQTDQAKVKTQEQSYDDSK